MGKSVYHSVFQYSILITLVLVSLLCYCIYQTATKALLARSAQADLLNAQYSQNQYKATNNDLALKKSNLEKENSILAKDAVSLLNSVTVEGVEINLMSANMKMKEDSLLLLQAQINQKNNDIQALLALIDEYYQATTLQKNIQQMKRQIDQMIIRPKEILGIDSKILTAYKEVETIKRWFNFREYFDMKLLFRVSEVKGGPQKFHEKCDKYPFTLTLVKLEQGTIMGGYTSQTWEGKGYKTDFTAFLFNLSLEKKYEVIDSSVAIQVNENFLPSFGKADLSLYPSLLLSFFPRAYGSNSQKLELSEGKKISNVVEIEVFQVILG